MGKFIIFWFACLLFLAGCPAKHFEPSPAKIFESIQADQLPDLRDDGEPGALRQALLTSISWCERLPSEKTFAFGSHSISGAVIRDSLVHLLDLLDSGDLNKDALARDFDVFRVVAPDRPGMLVTGYYEPVLEGSLKPGPDFRWPIYGVPPDLLTIDLERFDPERFKGERLTGRVENNRFVPFHTRAEIDGQKKLEGSGVQLAWLKDPVDCFFLHVQGSGVIRLPDGATRRVGYAGANGRPYRSIGKTLLEKGVLSREEMSLQAIRKYLKSNPGECSAIMWENESYVFFRFVSQGPVGSLNRVLTTGRSVASDPKFHPRGAAAFLVSDKPRLDQSGQVIGWDRLNRWVLHQDTGGAIKGPGRIDLFCGTGEAAEQIAGPMKQPGEMYYFIKKGHVPRDW